MEQYEQGTIDNAAAVSVACWFGQLAFGVLGGVITGFFGHLVSSSSSEVSTFSVVDACISLGSSFGVFASSSGGGNPCLFVSGGGPYGFLLILTSSTASVLVSKVRPPLRCSTQLLLYTLLKNSHTTSHPTLPTFAASSDLLQHARQHWRRELDCHKQFRRRSFYDIRRLRCRRGREGSRRDRQA